MDIDLGSLKRSFSKASGSYEQHAYVQNIMAQELCSYLKAALNQGKGCDRVLEIGCGPGNFTKVLLENFKLSQLCLNDLSDAMLKSNLASLASSSKYHNLAISSICGNALDLKLSEDHKELNQPFDLIVSNATFQWFSNLEHSLSKIAALARPQAIKLELLHQGPCSQAPSPSIGTSLSTVMLPSVGSGKTLHPSIGSGKGSPPDMGSGKGQHSGMGAGKGWSLGKSMSHQASNFSCQPHLQSSNHDQVYGYEPSKAHGYAIYQDLGKSSTNERSLGHSYGAWQEACLSQDDCHGQVADKALGQGQAHSLDSFMMGLREHEWSMSRGYVEHVAYKAVTGLAKSHSKHELQGLDSDLVHAYNKSQAFTEEYQHRAFNKDYVSGRLVAFSSFYEGNFAQIKELTGLSLNYLSKEQIIEVLERCALDYQVYFARHEQYFKSPLELFKSLKETGVNALSSTPMSASSFKALLSSYQSKYSCEHGVYLTWCPYYVIALL